MHLVLMNMFSYCKSGSHATAYPSFANHISLLILISVNHKIIITEISNESYADDLHGFPFVGELFLLSIKKRNTGSSQVFSEYQKCLIPFLLSSMVPDLNCVYYKGHSTQLHPFETTLTCQSLSYNKIMQTLVSSSNV